jgi:hypothetical protein
MLGDEHCHVVVVIIPGHHTDSFGVTFAIYTSKRAAFRLPVTVTANGEPFTTEEICAMLSNDDQRRNLFANVAARAHEAARRLERTDGVGNA